MNNDKVPSKFGQLKRFVKPCLPQNALRVRSKPKLNLRLMGNSNSLNRFRTNLKANIVFPDEKMTFMKNNSCNKVIKS